MRITLAGVAYIIIATLLLIYGLGKKDLFLYTLSLSMFLLVLYELSTFRSIARIARSITIERSIDKKFCREFDIVTIELKILNMTPVDIPRIAIEDSLPKYVELIEGSNKAMLSLPSRSGISLRYRVRICAPGSHVFDSTRISLGSVLGLFVETIDIHLREYVTAIPTNIDLHETLKSLNKILSVRILGRTVGGLYDLANIREYVYGDDVRKILWRVYARTGKLMVREDFGEARLRTLVLIDLRDFMWRIGSKYNTLAHIQLRYAQSIIEFLVKNSNTIDLAVCIEATPRIARDISTHSYELLYNLYSNIEPDHGCLLPLSVFRRAHLYLDREPNEYDIVILVTNPISLALEDPKNLVELLKTFYGKLLIAIPFYRHYEEYISREDLEALLKVISRLIESGGMGLLLSNEDLSITLKQRRRS